MTQGIYALVFKDDDSKYYIGKSLAGIKYRYKEHCSKLVNGTHVNYLLQDKYNELRESPILYIIEELNDPNIINTKEIFWINEFDSFRNGFNLTIGGEGSAPGEDHPRAIYTNSTYLAILEGLTKNYTSIRALADELGVNYDICSNIAYGNSHKHLKEVYPEIYNKALSKVGTRVVGSRCSVGHEIYSNVFKELATTTNSMKSIADKYDIGLNIVVDINKGQSHKYLHTEFPEYYAMIMRNKGKLVRSNVKWPDVLSPDGVVYTPVNMAEFCREHGLDAGGFSRVLNGKQKSTKGWTLYDAPK